MTMELASVLEMFESGVISPELSQECQEALNIIYGGKTSHEDNIVNKCQQVERNDAQFKRDVCLACNNKFIITGEQYTDILEDAHIKPFSQCQNNFE